MEKLNLPDSHWRKVLTPEQYQVLREGGTECAFTGALYKKGGEGVYACAGCGLPLFGSETKYNSGSGWPSYFAPIERGHVEERRDRSHGMVRTEVVCARCDGHLGHVFEDGPRPTGLRYCINSAALVFEPKEASK